jgi:hypothetical protein
LSHHVADPSLAQSDANFDHATALLFGRTRPWQECGKHFKHALEHHDVNGNVSRYLYTKAPAHLRPGGKAPLMITYAGCRRFCGAGKQPTD